VQFAPERIDLSLAGLLVQSDKHQR
jgi:hypothetical protein